MAVAVSKMVTKMLRHCDQDERKLDGSRHWDTIRSVLLRAFAQEGARDFDEGSWLHLIHEGSNKKRLEYCKDNNGSLCYLRAIQGHSGGIPIRPELMIYTLIPHKWKECIFHRGISSSFHSGEWNNSGWKREWQSSLHLRIHSETTRMKKTFILITLFTRRYIMKLIGNAI